MTQQSPSGPVDRTVGRMTEDERAWREGWAFAYSGAAHLYGDDGELQDNRWPPIDWMRDSAIEIRNKIRERGMRQLLAATAADTRKPCTCDGAGRGPGRACAVQAGETLGDLWRCAHGLTPNAVVSGERSESA